MSIEYELRIKVLLTNFEVNDIDLKINKQIIPYFYVSVQTP